MCPGVVLLVEQVHTREQNKEIAVTLCAVDSMHTQATTSRC